MRQAIVGDWVQCLASEPGKRWEAMMYTRFGDRIELVRLATIADVKSFERRKADQQDKDRTRDGWRAIAKYLGGPSLGSSNASGNGCGDENVGKEFLVDAAYIRAEGGWGEISDAFENLRGLS